MTTTFLHSDSRPGLFKRIGNGLRYCDRVLTEASVLRARWNAVSGLDTNQVQAFSGERFIA